MISGGFRFDRFFLDPVDRQLRRDEVPVELNSRYLDALALLVSEQGRLVSKDRFLEEVWRGVPVTDEALTQCIRTLRRLLGDDATRPRFIETVPRHGYRFVAPVERVKDSANRQPAPGSETLAAESRRTGSRRRLLVVGAAGTIGGGVAGILGGLSYGLIGSSQPLQSGTGAFSMLLVLVCLTMIVGVLGGAGVGFGIAAAPRRNPGGRHGPWSIAAGAAGGMVVGAVVKLLGIDAFNLLFGQSPGDITGAPEGALLGAAVGLGAWFGSGGTGALRLRRGVGAAALAGAAAGALIPMSGGRLMAGSLDLLASRFPNSRLRLDQLGSLIGETGLGPLTQILTGGLEGMLFCSCVLAAMILAERRLMERT